MQLQQSKQMKNEVSCGTNQIWKSGLQVKSSLGKLQWQLLFNINQNNEILYQLCGKESKR